MKKAVSFLILVMFIGLITGCSIKKVQELTDSEKFAKEFAVSKNNPFVYTNVDKVLNILDNGTGIIFFADSDYEGSLKAVKYILQVVKQDEHKNIYYYNPKKLREESPKKYKKLISYLKNYIKEDKFILPDIYAVKNGRVISHSNYFSNEKHLSEENLSKKKISKIKTNYTKILNYEECSECN